jgi:3-hydroxyacyl-CoA dehydrogenase/enoyl-CoA hydratase/3-hydroxybutyryl-CoA epimerase
MADTLPHLKNWTFSVDFEGLGWLTIDTPKAPVNTLSREAVVELETIVTAIEGMVPAGELKGVILLSAKESGFIAGADVAEFDHMADPGVLTGALNRAHNLLDRIEALKIPFVAGIHGFCLGGGLELALACRYRIAVNDDSTRIGFPEVNLGIFPGFGGSGRSIRQAGPVDAMQMMLTARLLRARQAKALNLVDKLVRHRDNLRWEARKAVLQNRSGSEAPWSKRVVAMAQPARKFIADQMRAEAKKKANPSISRRPTPSSTSSRSMATTGGR